jgi:N-hydroxyarylamine O-acetyltransferase
MIATPPRPATFAATEIAAYLARIGYEGAMEPTAEILRAIYRAHFFNVPFENLDIVPLGRPLSLQPETLYDKIVRRRRGGFCYELNGLLATVLRDLGYDVTIVAVQFVEATGALSPPFDHMALVVNAADVPHPWLVDVGAGRTAAAEPLPLIAGVTTFQDGVQRGFRLSLTSDRWRLDQQLPGEDWQPDYTFQLIPREIGDFLDRCRYQENDPASHFRQGMLCSLPTPNGRVTLSKNRLITTIDGERQECDVREDELADLLRIRFDIDLCLV